MGRDKAALEKFIKHVKICAGEKRAAVFIQKSEPNSPGRKLAHEYRIYGHSWFKMDAPENFLKNGSVEFMRTTVDDKKLNEIIALLTIYQKSMNPASKEEYLDCAIERADVERALRAIGVQLDDEGSILLMRGVHLQVKKRNPILAAYLQTIWNGVGCWPA